MSALILIADGDKRRAERIGEACAVRGLATQRVQNGAEALDAALSNVPDALVTSGELELISAAKLAQILRANPRTQSMRLFFLGSSTDTAHADSAGAEAIEDGADPEDVVRRVEDVIARSARLDAVDRQAETNQEVSGRLTQIPLADLLQLFQMNRRSGTISLRQRSAQGREERGRIHVREGEVVQAVTGTVDGEKALFRLLAWSDGLFAFRPEPIQLVPRIRTATRALLIEAMRQLDEWGKLGPALPSLDAQVTLRVRGAELPNVVHPVTQEVLLLLEVHSRVREVVDRCSFPDYQVLRTLQTLVERGIVEIRKGPILPASDSALFSRAQIRRLREWSAPAGRSSAPLRDAKLLIVSSDATATREFLSCLTGLPGMALEPGFAEGRLGADDMARVGRLRVDSELGIDLLHVPCQAPFAPLWPLAGHGALGALLLLSGAAPAAARALQPVAEVLRALSRVRLLPLLLGHEGETALPEEVRETLSLFEDSSVCFLSLAGGSEPSARLRNVLGRIVP